MDFFAVHTHWFLFILALMFFPRITLGVMLLTTEFLSGGVLWWLGYVFAPRLLIAFLSLAYWNTNPVLVVFTWIFAFMGESGEKSCCAKKKQS